MAAGGVSLEWPAIDSEQAFAQGVRLAVGYAVEHRCRELSFCGPDFAQWPLSDPELLALLSAFARLPGRQLTLLAIDYDVLRRAHPKFVAWRQTWGHAVSARAPVDEGATVPIAVLADRGVALELTDPEHWVGAWREAPLERQMLVEKVQTVMRRTQEAFAASVLGL